MSIPLITGTTQNITWTALDVPSNVQILLSRNGGLSWETIISNTPNTGSYAWVVTGPITGQALIQVTGLLYTDPADNSQTDYSNVTSIGDEFSISYPFTINTQPISQGTYTGGALNFVIIVSGGSGSYTYQWQRDGSNIFDASNNSYVISSFNPLTNGGQYAVSTSDGTTTLLSNTVQAGSLTEVLGTSTNMTTINNVPYKSSFVWELDPVTSLPVNVKVVNNF
jgi:hypothetical protein